MIEYNLEEESREISKRYKAILRTSYQSLTDDDKVLIRKALDLAIDAHKDQRRKTGEPYIYHPIAVAHIVASEIGLGAVAIASAFLHDVVEDTDYTIDDMERIFGKTIATIIDGLTKISGIQDQNISLQAENFRKMLLTLSDDVRVILIKLADRLHNMQTMDAMPRHKQLKISSETLFIYAPLAHRLGLFNIKTELEDLGLKYTEPEDYNEIVKNLEDSKEKQDEYIDNFSNLIEESLNAHGLTYTIKSRSKSIYSIRKKMINQSVSFDEVYDRFAVRIVYDSEIKEEKFNAWKIYSVITDHFQPNPSRLRDWLSSPKTTGYEALHTTVMGPGGKWVEVQIRSERMNEVAERGYAAHYKYKHGESEENALDHWLNQIKDTLENPDLNAVDFVDNFKLNLLSKEIYVFTPNGDLKSLPKGASTLDFAFSIHTQVGANCLGAKVNGKLVPLNYKLISGDQVEIITSKNQKPKSDWLEFVITVRAKSKIKTALKEERKLVADEGKEILARKLRHLKLNFDEETINHMVAFFNIKTSQDLFYKVAIGAIDSKLIKDFASQKGGGIVSFFKRTIARKPSSPKKVAKDDAKNYDQLVFGLNHEHLDYTLSKCCSPIPGDKVFGFITINEGIKVHKEDCPNAVSMQANYAYRIMKAKWIDSNDEDFIAILFIKGIDNIGIINQVTKLISNNLNINMKSLNIASDAGLFEGKITLTVHNQTQLKSIILKIKAIQGISKVTRIYKN
ncbi:MAG: bifunctional (p)ppGpp synthetase/guanosine-3',5'-bis(diphosphate) 3'-pyrophosphohydrolase [Flavobacteriales bacterium]|nr:bifunctional (p)ppGpp synthetase/guanosine-3',5'-bis(diphosphate) 3'-pyrophosphohydrolase [Flavobacteriales bacterium]